jgi:hypothetical protein
MKSSECFSQPIDGLMSVRCTMLIALFLIPPDDLHEFLRSSGAISALDSIL